MFFFSGTGPSPIHLRDLPLLFRRRALGMFRHVALLAVWEKGSRWMSLAVCFYEGYKWEWYIFLHGIFAYMKGMFAYMVKPIGSMVYLPT